jgi:hypothetical protein
MCSKVLLDQIQETILKFGIDSKLRLGTKKGRVANRNVNDCYVLRIQKIEHVKKWFNIIGSSNPRHQTRYAVWQKFGFLPPRTNINQRKAILEGELDPHSFY